MSLGFLKSINHLTPQGSHLGFTFPVPNHMDDKTIRNAPRTWWKFFVFSSALVSSTFFYGMCDGHNIVTGDAQQYGDKYLSMQADLFWHQNTEAHPAHC